MISFFQDGSNTILESPDKQLADYARFPLELCALGPEHFTTGFSDYTDYARFPPELCAMSPEYFIRIARSTLIMQGLPCFASRSLVQRLVPLAMSP